MAVELSLAVVGADYANADKGKSNRRFEIALCAPGDPVSLVLEPKNPADSNAIAVFSARNIQIGYLTAERAPFIGGLLRSGETANAVFQSDTSYGAVIRVAWGDAQPTLPITRQVDAGPAFAADPESGFYPDFIPPDE